MKRSVPFVLVALAILFALPAVAEDAAPAVAAPETPTIADAEPGACTGAAATAAAVLAASQGDLPRTLGLPEPTPQHCTDCCTLADRQACKQNCPGGCFCFVSCLDCNTHWCVCDEICGP